MTRLQSAITLFLLLPVAAVHLGCGDAPPASSVPLDVGDELRTALTLELVEGGVLAVQDLVGGRPTVFYAWSVPCPCVANAEMRVQALIEAYGERVRWIAVAGEPLDIVEGLREQKLRFGSPYAVLRDPEQQLCRLLRLDSAALTAVLDNDGVLVYRGPLDTDFVHGKGEFLKQALDALLAGEPVKPAERPRTYGCFFSDPASCRQPR